MDNHEASNANERNLIGSDFKSMSENHALSKVGSERLIRPGHTVDDVNQAGISEYFPPEKCCINKPIFCLSVSFFSLTFPSLN